jgi:hypothetical protein
MKKYTLYWLTGDKEIVNGYDIADAVRRSGYGGGALRALDFWELGESSNWLWDKEAGKWKWLEIERIMKLV